MNKIDVSCIIISNCNDLFVKERTIPSIIENSKSHNIEIIVADNSLKQNFEYEGVKVIHTEPYHIPKAYNTGVKEASGKYVAFFHDDCEILDYKWITKLINYLDDETILVGVEKHTHPHDGISYLKEVPSMMKREDFYLVGQYDETYYFGYEDTYICGNTRIR